MTFLLRFHFRSYNVVINTQIVIFLGSTLSRCFVLVEVPNDLQFQFITMLQKGFIVSPERAVKAWLASRPVTVHPVVGEKSNAQRTFHHEELHR